MTENKMLNDLDSEIEELEKEMYGKPEGEEKEPESGEVVEEETTEEVTNEEDSETVDPPEEEYEEPEVEPEQLEVEEGSEEDAEEVTEPKEPKKKKRVSYKSKYEEMLKRYNGLRGSRDTKNYQLTQQNRQLLATVENLQARVTATEVQLDEYSNKVDIYDDVFSQEDIDTVGEEAVDLIKKSNKALIEKTVKPLQEKLRAEEAMRLKANQEAMEQINAQDAREFLGKVESLVPNFKAIDSSPAFSDYMNDYDSASGLQRLGLLQQAQRNGDVVRVAQFFKEFESIQAQPDSVLEEQIVPDSRTQTATIPTKKKGPKSVRLSDFNQFYDKLTRGGFLNNQKEGDRLERYYDRAFAEGRIIDDL